MSKQTFEKDNDAYAAHLEICPKCNARALAKISSVQYGCLSCDFRKDLSKNVAPKRSSMGTWLLLPLIWVLMSLFQAVDPSPQHLYEPQRGQLEEGFSAAMDRDDKAIQAKTSFPLD